MFGTKHNECIGYESRWKVKKVYMEAQSQTTEYSVTDRGTNTQQQSSIEVQTEYTQHSINNDEALMERLAVWLSKIYPKVKEQIEDISNSSAFKGYNLLSDHNEANCKILQTLDVSKFFNKIEESHKISKITSLTWNNTGKYLGITCTYNHKTWCNHNGCVIIYTFDRDGNLSEQPLKKLSTESCISSLRFHPGNSTIISAGTITGNLLVWNIQNEGEEDLIAIKNIHDEIVTQVSWIRDLDKTLLIATSSTDGFLKLWTLSLSKGLRIKTCYKLKGPILSNNDDKVAEETAHGIVCFDFCEQVPDIFVICLEGGAIVQCSMSGANELKGSTKDDPIFDPSVTYHEPYEGEIISVCFSPNRREMFMTYGSNGEIRIYIVGQEDPARVIFVKDNLTDLAFVPYEEKLAIGCGPGGVLKIFNIQSGDLFENNTSEYQDKIISTCMSINPIRTHIVAVGNENGQMKLWNVPWSTFTMK